MRRRLRLRLLPVVVVAAGVLLSVKVGGIWQSLDDAPTIGLAAPAAAEQAEAEPSSEGHGEAESSAKTYTEPPPPTVVGTESVGGVQHDPDLLELSALSDGEVELLQSLVARSKELDARTRDLETQAEALALAEDRLDAKLQQLKELQAQIEALVVERDEAQETQLKSLVKIYENMKPKDAAPIFDQLEMVILLDVIERMKEAKVAPILALMSPERAKSVTQELAVRREMPPPGG